MDVLILLLIIVGIPWFLWYLFYKSVLWVLEPISNYMKDKEEERILIEHKGPFKVTITVESIDRSFDINQSIYKKAQKKPQKIAGSDLWVYKNSLMSFKSAREKLLEILREENKENDGDQPSPE